MKQSNRTNNASETGSAEAHPQDRGGIHDGHRGRLRERYRTEGLDGFRPHQAMELLLTFCIPRVDVNEQAHALIDRFGSFSAVLDAPEEELCRVSGIGPKTAAFLAALPDFCRLYMQDKCRPAETMDTVGKLADYLHTLYIGVSREQLHLLLFDNSMRLLDCSCIVEGTVNSVKASVRTIVERALQKKASCAVLSHNHPGGLPFPSDEDKRFTDAVACALEVMEIPLLEHFLVTETICTPILRSRRGILRASPLSGEAGLAGEDFWRRFYGEDREDDPVSADGKGVCP